MNPKEPPLDLAVMRHMPIGELIKLKPQALQVLVRQADDDLRRAKMVKDWLHGILSQKYEDQAKALRQQTGKDTGVVRLDDNGITVLCELPKKVEWDQDKLSRIVEKRTKATTGQAGIQSVRADIQRTPLRCTGAVRRSPHHLLRKTQLQIRGR